jgi:hypothetical protein
MGSLFSFDGIFYIGIKQLTYTGINNVFAIIYNLEPHSTLRLNPLLNILYKHWSFIHSCNKTYQRCTRKNDCLSAPYIETTNEFSFNISVFITRSLITPT